MEFNINKDNFTFAYGASGGFCTFYYEDEVPQYIIDKLGNKCVSFVKGRTEHPMPFRMPVEYKGEWPTEDELDCNKHVLCTMDNIANCLKFTKLEPVTLDPDVAKYYKVRLVDKIPFNTWYRDDIDCEELKRDYLIVDYFPRSSSMISNYRRNAKSKFLSKRFGSKYIHIDKPYKGKAKYLVISFPSDCVAIPSFIKSEKIIYERTDNWQVTGEKYSDDFMLGIADVVVCSSKWLYEQTKEMTKAKVILIENGGTRYVVENTVKDIDRYCYIGKHSDKVDYEWMNSLDKEVDLFGPFESVDLSSYPRLHKVGYFEEAEMVEKISHYQAGLVAFVNSDWTKGMMPIKLYNYKNAGLDIIYHNCEEADIDLDTMNWDYVFKKWVEAVDIKDEVIVNDNLHKDVVTFLDEDCYSINWTLTHACNFDCPYCIQKKQGVRPDFKVEMQDLLRVADKLHELMVKSKWKKYKVTILGGEPSVCPYLHEIVDKLTDPKYFLTVSILTNLDLHDVDYWNKFNRDMPYRKVIITATCHLDQIKNLDAWMDKAKHVMNVHVKFVVGDSNYKRTKEVIEKYKLQNFNICGMRDNNNHPLFGDETKAWIDIYGDERTDKIIKIHSMQKADCWRRIGIRGTKVVNKCPFAPIKEHSIFDEEGPLDWLYVKDCDMVWKCSGCMVQHVVGC